MDKPIPKYSHVRAIDSTVRYQSSACSRQAANERYLFVCCICAGRGKERTPLISRRKSTAACPTSYHPTSCRLTSFFVCLNHANRHTNSALGPHYGGSAKPQQGQTAVQQDYGGTEPGALKKPTHKRGGKGKVIRVHKQKKSRQADKKTHTKQIGRRNRAPNNAG